MMIDGIIVGRLSRARQKRDSRELLLGHGGATI
jgi:hypothetical protein